MDSLPSMLSIVNAGSIRLDGVASIPAMPQRGLPALLIISMNEKDHQNRCAE